MTTVSSLTSMQCRIATRLQNGADADTRRPLLVPEARRDAPGSVGVPLSASLDLEHAILHLLAANQAPLGSGTLMAHLHHLGYHGSEPTVGRFLRLLDRRGLTTRVSNKGRDLTEAGRRHLQHLCEADAQRMREHALMRTIRTTTIEDLLDVLVARRALERETACLAAEHATAAEIAQLGEAIREQRQALATSGVAIDADVTFHALLAQASRNRVLAAAIDLIRRDKHLTVALDAILKQTDHRWVVGHDRILTAIKRRAPAAAERAMLDHINSVIADIRRYGDRLALASSAAAADGPAHAATGQPVERRG
jgi:GntR family transcriptional repressor for pyruvate dehydrogenase complex